MSRNEYLTTGEVARMMGTTKNTLFHYDQLGILHRPPDGCVRCHYHAAGTWHASAGN